MSTVASIYGPSPAWYATQRRASSSMAHIHPANLPPHPVGGFYHHAPTMAHPSGPVIPPNQGYGHPHSIELQNDFPVYPLYLPPTSIVPPPQARAMTSIPPASVPRSALVSTAQNFPTERPRRRTSRSNLSSVAFDRGVVSDVEGPVRKRIAEPEQSSPPPVAVRERRNTGASPPSAAVKAALASTLPAHPTVQPTSRGVRFDDNPVCATPPPHVPRRKGWFNKKGDQLWTNDGLYRPAIAPDIYPPDLSDYPEENTGWMDENGVCIDMKHRRVPTACLRPVLKKTSSSGSTSSASSASSFSPSSSSSASSASGSQGRRSPSLT